MTATACPAFVMVVDDDTDLRETLIEVLQDKAYRTVGASNGQEALDLLHTAPGLLPCVILLDLMMPVMDGRQFRAALLLEPELSEIPIIVLSAHADVDELFPGLSVAARLRKPVDLAPLLSLVDRHCKEPPAALG